MRYKILCLILIIIISITGCGNQKETIIINNDSQDNVANNSNSHVLDNINLNQSEKNTIENIQSKGYISIAVRPVSTVYEKSGPNITGYNYELIENLANELNVDLKVTIVNNISDYFKTNGSVPDDIITNNSYSYTPDLLENVDIYVDTITRLKWRENLINFITFVPIKEMTFHNKNVNIQTKSDLADKKIAVQKESSYYTTIMELEDQTGVKFNLLLVDSIEDTLAMVNSGEADVALMDSNRLFLEVKNYDNIQVGPPVTDVKYVGWAVQKGNDGLRSLLEKYINETIDMGLLNEYWLNNYAISFYDYYTLILKESTTLETMNLSNKENEYIDTLRSHGVLNVAMRSMKTGYDFVDGEPVGYNYLLIKDFADTIGVDLNVVIADSFSQYFNYDGETPSEIKTDPNYFYIPDMFDKVDIYVDNIAHLDWRNQILNQINVTNVRNVTILRKEANYSNSKDLEGLKMAVPIDTSYDKIADEIMAENNIKFEKIYYDTIPEVFDAVSKREADFTITESNISFFMIEGIDNLKIGFPVTDLTTIGWAVRKDDVTLAGILQKYIDASKKNGKFDDYWKKTFGISFSDYIRLLSD